MGDTTFSSFKPAMRWYSSVVEVRSMITCLDVPENAPCRDHKLLCGGLASHLSIPRLTTLIKSPRYRDVLNGKRVKDERTYCLPTSVCLSSSHCHRLPDCSGLQCRNLTPLEALHTHPFPKDKSQNSQYRL